MLHGVSHGAAGDGPPLVIAHGLFGSARNWGVIAKRLAEARQVIAVDMRNHGDSPWQDSHRYRDLAADLAGVIAGQGGRADVLGHSMGGKAAMALALTRPEMVRKLIVADIAPVAYGHSQSHLIAAMRALPLEQVTTRGDADRLLAGTVTDDATRAFLLQSLDLNAPGGPRWRLNLDVLEAEMDRITGWPDDLDGRFDGPALFLSGAASDYVRPEARGRIKALFPGAVMAKIPGAGHWLHAEKPREFEAAVAAFLDAA
ncbi:MAG: alpha/beta fold hydrolase [Rhodobacteraceae bacterium]|nr:alpha/beta fold hydrolase [Paracoccaceae bacterium]